MKKEISRIEPWSAVRVGFFFGLLTGILFGFFNGFFIKLLAGTTASSLLPPDAKELSGLSGGAMVALAIIMGLIFSLIYAITAAIGAVFYNAVARLFGGLEFTTSGETEPHAAEASEMNDEEPPRE